MGECSGITKDGSLCQISAPEGARYCHIHQKQHRRRLIIRVTAILAALAAVIAFVANISQITSFLIQLPRSTPTVIPSSELVEELLDYSGTVQADPEVTGLTIFENMTLQKEKECKEDRHNSACWIILGQMYVTQLKYREALDAYTISYEINPKMADPHYATGNLHYDLAMLDLIRKERFAIDADNLAFTVYPDEDSAVLFAEVINQFSQGDSYQSFQDLYPSAEFILTTMYIVEHRRGQINDFLSGSTTIEFHRLELLRAFRMTMAIYHPSNDEVVEKAVKLGVNVFEYIQKHPEEFPYLMIPSSMP